MNRLLLVFCFLSVKLSSPSRLTVDQKCQLQNQTLGVYYWDKQPFIYESSLQNSIPKGFFVTIIQEGLKQCCLATNIDFVKVKSGPAGLHGLLDSGGFDLIMPVGAFPESFKVRNSHYVGIAESAGTAVLMLANASGAKLMLSVLQAWPILVFIIVSALLAGVVIWLLERNGKFNQFSESFCLGIFEGFWWAFCTMTTVGYGDRAPKTVFGKILGTVWMLIGVIIVTMFISIITTSLTSASYAQYTCIRGMKVSVVNQSAEHTLAIRSNAKVYASPNQQTAFDEMINRVVDASLIDTHALKHHHSNLKHNHVVVASVVGNYVSYGALLSTNASRLQACLNQFMDTKENWRFELLREAVGGKRVRVTPAEDYFGSGGIFSISVYSGLALFVVLFITGLIWEYQKTRKKDKKSYQVNHKVRGIQPSKNTTRINKGILTNGTSSSIPREAATTIEQTKQQRHRTNEQLKRSPPTLPQSYGDTPRERLIARQRMEVLELEKDFYRFEKEWEKRFNDVQMKQTTGRSQLDN